MKVRIVSPAKALDASKIDYASKLLSDAGYEVEVAVHAKGQCNYFSGTDDERLRDFQAALDEDVDVILCSRGGYGSVRIVDRLDFTKFVARPKLILGFSDITVFHNHIQGNLNLPTVHCTAPLNFAENTKEAILSLLNVLDGLPNNYSFAANDLNRMGDADAVVVGGNLSVFASLIGTNSDVNTDGKILFLEDIGEAVYSIDRMMLHLKKAGKLNNIAALMIGGLTDIKDSEAPFGQTAEQVIKASVESYDFPVCFNFPAGHIDDNRAIVFGKRAKLIVAESVTFQQ